jgi:hypothetical protein
MTAADDEADPLRVPPWLGDLGRPSTWGPPVPPDRDDDAAGPPLPAPPLSAPPAPPGEPAAPPEEPGWSAATDRDGWHVAEEPSELRAALAPWRPRLIVTGVAAVLSLLSVLLIAALFDGDDPGRRAAPPPLGSSLAGVSLPGGPGPGPSPTGAAPTSPPPATTAAASRSAPASPPPRFGPVTFEAEAPGNVLGGSAWVDRYAGASGGSIVRNLGDWGGRDGAGFLRFENITVPAAGTYTLRLFHVNIDNERTRTAVVTVAGRDPQRVTLAGGSTCCTGSSLRVTLRKGGNAITVTNPDGHAPAVDRIVLSLP